jgi:mono/diheme cytochrome c family protein
MRARSSIMLALLSVTGLLTGCEKAMHDMYVQPRYGPGTSSTLFADGNSSRTPPAGTLSFGAGDISSSPPVRTGAVLERGRSRFNIYCAPCHGESGDGAGIVVARGFPAPPSYHTAKLRDTSDAHIYDVISHGYGVMYPYADRIDPSDRWAIVGYIRALQLSQNAACGKLDAADLRRLGPPAGNGARVNAACGARP